MEEKLFMKRQKKWLNVTSGKKRRMKQENPCLRRRTEVCSLADLTSCFVLSLAMGVGRGLRNKRNEEKCQANSK